MKSTGYNFNQELGRKCKFDPSLISREIQLMLDLRGNGKTICPSEVARKLDSTSWRDHMENVHEVVIAMVEVGMVIITQKDKPVDPLTRKGAYRIKKI